MTAQSPSIRRADEPVRDRAICFDPARERPALTADAAQPPRALVPGASGVPGFAWTVGALSAPEVEANFDARSPQLLGGTSAGTSRGASPRSAALL